MGRKQRPNDRIRQHSGPQLTLIFKDGLEYVPATAGTGSITITVNDLGFAGLGGPQTGTNVITVQVSSF